MSAVSRTHAGQTLGQVLDEPGLATPIFASVGDALAVACDVVVEYTSPDSATFPLWSQKTAANPTVKTAHASA